MVGWRCGGGGEVVLGFGVLIGVEFLGEFDDLVEGQEELNVAFGDGHLELFYTGGPFKLNILFIQIERELHLIQDLPSQLIKVSLHQLNSYLLTVN